jgi:anti-sigma factor RsiW
MQCRDFREIADSFLSDELLVETNHDVLRHLEACADCRNELAARRELRARLREAVKNDKQFQMRDEFAAELKAKLFESSSKKTRNIFTFQNPAAWLAIAASFVLIALIIGVALRQYYKSPNNIRELATHFAIGDHKNCAIQHNLKEDPISLEEAAKKYDKSYAELDKAVMKPFADDKSKIELLGSHHCIFEGQKFAHVVLRYQGKVVSVLVTERGNKETAANNSQAISCSSADGYQISCFETSRHSVFIVSDLSEQENLTIARQLQSSVVKHLA